MGLGTYRDKRDFARTPEPAGGRVRARRGGLVYLVQKHAARRLHYDFRLEWEGVLKSWAVPKGPPLVPGAKALAMQTEDHPLEYAAFEGVIPKGQYGGGTVMLWDRGTWEPEGDAAKGLAAGKLTFAISGERLRGKWSLVRMRVRQGSGRRDTGREWLLIKRSDAERSSTGAAEPERSVVSGRTMEEIAAAGDRVWTTEGEQRTGDQAAEFASAVAQTAGARPAAVPRDLTPQLATLVAAAPDGADWLHEIKYDGYRLLARKQGARVRLLSRSGQDWTAAFPRVARALARLPVAEAVLDGEVVVLTADGRTDFQALQNSMRRREAAHVLFAFDLPFAAGHDLRAVPLVERKALLARLLAAAYGAGEDADVVRFSEHVRGQGAAFHASACRHGLEGIVSKRADAPYASRRTRTWVKVKCAQRQEFVVVGWTEPEGTRAHFGALLLAHQAAGGLRYCGRVGTGFTQASLAAVASRLRGQETESPPVVDPPRGAAARGVHWVRPVLVAEVAFQEWTADGVLRHPTFHGLRDDKPAARVRREAPVATEDGGRTAIRQSSPAPAKSAAKSPARAAAGDRDSVAGVRLTHPDRVLYPELGLTKRQLAEYCAAVADHALPHVVDRPLTLVRCPSGRQAQCFYQKHTTASLPPAVRSVEIQERGGKASYVAVHDLTGLVSLVQIGVLEWHPWGCRSDRPDRPDRMVFDLDPHDRVAWADVVATAHVLRERLERLGFASFVRTTGGKGLHVVVPIERRATWDEVKEFARDLVTAFARAAPDRYVTTASKAERTGRIFLDYLRNARGATAVAAYSPRARPGAPVATPLRWDELTARLRPAEFSVPSMPSRLAALPEDPWAGFFTTRQALTKGMRAAVAR